MASPLLRAPRKPFIKLYIIMLIWFPDLQYSCGDWRCSAANLRCVIPKKLIKTAIYHTPNSNQSPTDCRWILIRFRCFESRTGKLLTWSTSMQTDRGWQGHQRWKGTQIWENLEPPKSHFPFPHFSVPLGGKVQKVGDHTRLHIIQCHSD